MHEVKAGMEEKMEEVIRGKVMGEHACRRGKKGGDNEEKEKGWKRKENRRGHRSSLLHLERERK